MSHSVKGVGSVKHIIIVLSGKGGVGKTTVAAQMAQSLCAEGKRVGLLDVDLCGPSVAKVLGLEGKEVMQSSGGWVPVFADTSQNLVCMSIAFLLKSSEEAVVWRGPKKNAMIKQFLEDVMWGDLDILIIDTPPGTSDEQISTIELLRGFKLDGAVIVTTPQQVSVVDVRKEMSFAKKMNVPIIGIVENMSGFVCPCCQEVTDIFSRGGGEALAKETDTCFLGRIPIDPSLAKCEDGGVMFLKEHKDSATAQAVRAIVETIWTSVASS